MLGELLSKSGDPFPHDNRRRYPSSKLRELVDAVVAEAGGALAIFGEVDVLANAAGISPGASKAGLVQLTRTLAREWADHGVRVNAVSPATWRRS